MALPIVLGPALLALADPLHVACVGDSITQHGCASADNMTYPVQLGKLLGDGFVVSNFGDSGKTMLKGGFCSDANSCGNDCSYWDQTTYVQALQSKPDIVTIMMGTNDAKWCNWFGAPNGSPAGAGTNFVADYIAMITSFIALPNKPQVWLVLPPPLAKPADVLPLNMSADVINNKYPAMQRDIAKISGATGVIDVWTALGGASMDPAMTCDGCHPKDAGLGIIAKTIAASIKKSALVSEKVFVG